MSVKVDVEVVEVASNSSVVVNGVSSTWNGDHSPVFSVLDAVNRLIGCPLQNHLIELWPGPDRPGGMPISKVISLFVNNF
jgi:hypothetical protein